MCNQPLFTLYFSVLEILQGFYSPFHSFSLYPFHLSLSLPLYISPSTFLSLSLLLSLFSLSFSLVYPMDVSVLVFFKNAIIFANKNWALFSSLARIVTFYLLHKHFYRLFDPYPSPPPLNRMGLIWDPLEAYSRRKYCCYHPNAK